MFHKKLTWKLFEEILIFCTEGSSYFSCLNKKWFQIDGCAMGNSLSPLLTDIVLTELQNKSISKMGFMMKLIVKYLC